jgi:hypothetical protein
MGFIMPNGVVRFNDALGHLGDSVIYPQFGCMPSGQVIDRSLREGASRPREVLVLSLPKCLRQAQALQNFNLGIPRLLTYNKHQPNHNARP